MRIILTILTLLGFFHTGLCQGNLDMKGYVDKNSTQNQENSGFRIVHIEGSIALQSINFETKLYESTFRPIQFNGRIGVGYIYVDAIGVIEAFGGLACVSLVTGRNNNHFETTLGAFLGPRQGVITYPILTVGYKYQKPEGGLIFRANAGTLIIGVGFGYAF